MRHFGRDEYTRTFDKTIPVHAGVRILLEHKLGDVTIHTHNSSDVMIHADIRVSARGQQDAKAFADRIDILVDSSSSVLSIRTRYPEQSNSFFGMNNTSYSVRYDLTVPESSPFDVHNSFGAVSVSGVKASSNITNSHGDLIFRDGQGTQRLDNSFARIEVSNNVGDVTVEGSNGAVDVKDVNGAISIRNRFASVTVAHASKGVRVVNSNGAVSITDSGGSGSVKNSFGEVRATTFHGDLTVNNSNGRVEATDVDGASELNTSFGEVRFSNIGHQLSVRSNNGKVEGSRVGGSVNVVNSFGQVTVRDVQGSAHIESGNSGVSISGVKEDARVKTSFGMVDASRHRRSADRRKLQWRRKGVERQGRSDQHQLRCGGSGWREWKHPGGEPERRRGRYQHTPRRLPANHDSHLVLDRASTALFRCQLQGGGPYMLR